MKLDKLEIKNLGVLAEAVLTPTRPIALILGENATGKSTARRALELLIRGDVADLEGSQAYGAKDLLGPADTTAYVTGLLAVGERQVALKRILAGGTFTAYVNGKPATKELYDFFSPTGMKDPAAAWRTLFNASAFFEADAMRQQGVLVGLIEQAVAFDLLSHLPLKDYPTPSTLAEFPIAYKHVFEARTQVNRQRNATRVPSAPTNEREDVAAIEARLRELRGEEIALVTSVAEGVGLRKAAQKRRDEAVAAYQVPTPAMTLEDASRAVSVARTALETAQKAEAAIQEGAGAPSRGTLINRRDKFSEALVKLKELGAGCVIHSDIACPLTTTKRAETVRKWEKDVGVLSGQIDALPAPATTPTSALERAVGDAEARVTSIASHETQMARRGREVAEADDALAAVPVVTEPPALATLRTRIATGEGNLALARRLNQAWDEHEAGLAKSTTLTEQAADLDILVAAFGPKGIGGKLLAERLGALVALVNASLRSFQMFLTVSSEPWAVKVNGRHPVLMSDSERFRAGVALQIALAEVTGARWVLIDGADILGPNNRNAMFGLLLQAVEEGRIEQAIVTATTMLTPAGVRGMAENMPDGIELWSIAGGTLVSALTLTVEEPVPA